MGGCFGGGGMENGLPFRWECVFCVVCIGAVGFGAGNKLCSHIERMLSLALLDGALPSLSLSLHSPSSIAKGKYA